ncbi:aspartyl-phosphate phosphatase Spo0E family protein [Paenibacillus elgii]|uniref:aspartyl-phosphate phosphatase Spo0E family protein n=1 Tax=Paenibacillus elgii TaxID=189691 RepID=UPI00203DB559|nr:aspartyl-phosphate phosphatase Spo0E family protein [Paenibacillus elgii]MCM3271556.1 aspartyl-phosphate phosphatase Spo0E family protein [Paenibacillus elgii]
MLIQAQLEHRIRCCIDELNALLTGQGCLLTDPKVLHKSMELDELILLAMRPLQPAGQAAV